MHVVLLIICTLNEHALLVKGVVCVWLLLDPFATIAWHACMTDELTSLEPRTASQSPHASFKQRCSFSFYAGLVYYVAVIEFVFITTTTISVIWLVSIV